jgi:hypothetical protein
MLRSLARSWSYLHIIQKVTTHYFWHTKCLWFNLHLLEQNHSVTNKCLVVAASSIRQHNKIGIYIL